MVKAVSAFTQLVNDDVDGASDHELLGAASAFLPISTDGDDVIFGGVGADMIDGRAGNDRIDGGGGDDTLSGGAGDDVLSGNVGNDTLIGGDGNDTYIWNRGDGHDVIDEAGVVLSQDTLVLKDVSTSEVRLKRSGQEVTLVIGGKNAGSVKLLNVDPFAPGSARDPAIASNAGVETVVFSDTIWTLDVIRSKVLAQAMTAGNDRITGFHGNDEIAGGAGNDRLEGLGGNDTITGGRGNDRLIGGEGNDTYIWRRGDGDDSIDEAAPAVRRIGWS